MRRRETHQTARAAHRLCVSGEGAEVFAGKWFLRIPRGDLDVIHSELTVPKNEGLALETLTVSALPSLERQPVLLVFWKRSWWGPTTGCIYPVPAQQSLTRRKSCR